MKLHTGDSVVIISGKDKGKAGTIMRVLPLEQRVVITGINIRTKHVKKTYQQAGQILKYEASIHASKVMLIDPKTKKPSRIGFTMDDKGKKTRISKLSGEEVKHVKPAAMKKATAKKTTAEETSKETKKAVPEGTVEKKPFWKRTFGGGQDSAATAEEPRSKQDHSIAAQNIPKKSAGRGS